MAFGSAAVAAGEGATPWPAAKAGDKVEKKEFVQNILESPPPRAAEVLKPIEDISGTIQEEASLDTGEKESLEESLAKVIEAEKETRQQAMDMTTTDNDGNMEEDTSVGVPIVKDNDRVTRRQRQQDGDENGKGSQERSRSRPQTGPGVPPQGKRTLKGSRSETVEPDTKPTPKGLDETFKKGDPLVTGAAWNSWVKNGKNDNDISMTHRGEDHFQTHDPWGCAVPESEDDVKEKKKGQQTREEGDGRGGRKR